VFALDTNMFRSWKAIVIPDKLTQETVASEFIMSLQQYECYGFTINKRPAITIGSTAVSSHADCIIPKQMSAPASQQSYESAAGSLPDLNLPHSNDLDADALLLYSMQSRMEIIKYRRVIKLWFSTQNGNCAICASISQVSVLLHL